MSALSTLCSSDTVPPMHSWSCNFCAAVTLTRTLIRPVEPCLCCERSLAWGEPWSYEGYSLVEIPKPIVVRKEPIRFLGLRRLARSIRCVLTDRPLPDRTNNR